MIWYILIFIAGFIAGLVFAAAANVYSTIGTLYLNNTDPESEFFTLKLDGKNVDYCLFKSTSCTLKIDRSAYKEPSQEKQGSL